MPRTTPHNKNKVYFVGSGIASLAGAAFLIRDGLIPGDNIHILEELEITGGSLDGAGSADEGYVIRGGRMMEEHYVCTYDLFAGIPSLTDSAKSVKDEIVEFSRKYVSASRCRLVRDGKKVDVSSFELSEKIAWIYSPCLSILKIRLAIRALKTGSRPRFLSIISG